MVWFFRRKTTVKKRKYSSGLPHSWKSWGYKSKSKKIRQRYANYYGTPEGYPAFT